MSYNKELLMWWNKREVHEKLVLWIVFAYILQTLLPFLFRFPTYSLISWVALPGNFWEFIVAPWSLVTYAFFHASFSHLFWNMVMLYFGGQMFLNLFSTQRFYNVFFLGVLTGGVVFLISYLIFPVFSGDGSSLIGASAGVTAILIFICTYTPYQTVRLFFFNVKLWQIGVFFILTDLIQIPNGNAGGHLAHIGGGILGFVYARKLKEGTDIGTAFERIWSQCTKWFSGPKKTPLRTAHKTSRSRKTAGVTKAYQDREHQKKIDAILDKISHSGYDSLSKEEKDYLFQSGKT